MNKSYLYFQGPPGVGKTYTAGFIILELLKKSKKIGITANSHKVIFNLLKQIEELTNDENNKNFSFRGIHKAGSTEDKRYKDADCPIKLFIRLFLAKVPRMLTSMLVPMF